MRVIVISNMFVDLRFRSMLKNEFDNNILLDVFKPDELISEYSQFKNGKYDLCIVWINLLIEYPEMEEDVIFERCKLEDAVGLCKEFLISIKEKAESISLSQIWIQQDQFWRSSWHYFPYQLNKKGIINSLCSLIPEMLPYRCKIIDINDIIAQIGVGQAYDNKKSRRWGNPYTSRLEQAIVKNIKRMSSSTRLMSPKCIVLDCDNVLWGGVVGEDGIEGIELGNEGIGLRYQKFQRIILNLYLTGTIVALCSKNDDVDVKQVFQLHTGMILKWNNIAATKINWLSKVENIIGILEELGIEEKDVVFVDDSIEEIELVKSELPEIQTLLFHRDNILEVLNYFNIDSNFDLQMSKVRQETYLTNSMRKELSSHSCSYDEYLKKLNTKLDIHEIMEQEVDRISELSKRTNKCTIGLRYTIEEIKKLMCEKSSKVYTITAKDAFSSLGIVGGYAVVDGCMVMFCLSCRVLGRNLEYIILDEIFIKGKCKEVNFVSGERNRWLIDLLSKYNAVINYVTT